MLVLVSFFFFACPNQAIKGLFTRHSVPSSSQMMLRQAQLGLLRYPARARPMLLLHSAFSAYRLQLNKLNNNKKLNENPQLQVLVESYKNNKVRTCLLRLHCRVVRYFGEGMCESLRSSAQGNIMLQITAVSGKKTSKLQSKIASSFGLHSLHINN